MHAQDRMQVGSKVVAGTILVLAGGALALAQMGVVSAYELSRGWPVFLIVAGIVQLMVTIRQPRQTGWGLLLLGDWFFVNTMTDWAYSQLTLPLMLAGAGAFMIVGATRRASAPKSLEYRRVA